MNEKITKDMIVGQIGRQYPQTLEVFYKYDIDDCCNVDANLELAAQDRGVDIEELIKDLNQAIAKPLVKQFAGVITKEMTMGEIVKQYPQVAPIMLDFGLHCVGCHVAFWETLEEGIASHGMTEDDLDALLKQLNEAIKK
ncbi:MAG TPA: DUF542 domain-containing protein [Patescibacteria group bacterium]